jgi:hypothetical protein
MAVQAGVVQIFDRVMSELSLKIKRLDVDQMELACLKAIIVFNPGELGSDSTGTWAKIRDCGDSSVSEMSFSLNFPKAFSNLLVLHSSSFIRIANRHLTASPNPHKFPSHSPIPPSIELI